MEIFPDANRGRTAGSPVRLALTAAWVLLGAGVAQAQDVPDPSGRDFPKTLTLDEPGVDDEVSLPTFTHLRDPATTQDDISVEIDKRATETLQLQFTGGYRIVSTAGGNAHYGWDNLALAAKNVLLDQPQTETILTAGLMRDFGRTGAVGIGAEKIGSTTPIFYFGQGLGATALPALLRPFALTGTLGYQWPDRLHGPPGEQAAQALLIGMSLQYSLHYLAPALAQAGLPAAATHILAIAELTYALPTTRAPGTRHGTLAPGLIYAGAGYQLAMEALLPLTHSSGTGVIAQLNLSFETLGLGAFAKPLLK